MERRIEDIHEEVYHSLMQYHSMDEDFLFTFRKINRKARLEKGYWFLGNEDYLAVSFWRGNDWLTKLPKISFIINKDGYTSLEFSCKYTSQKIDYFELSMINAVGASELGYEYGYRKFYPEFKSDYISSLKSFVEHDKLIIDDFIKRDMAFNPGALEYTDALEFIYPGDFKKQLAKVSTYRKLLRRNIKKTGYLTEFSIGNFGPIKNASLKGIPKGCKWIFITGENGAGKSSLLKALATGLFQNNDNDQPIASGFGDFVIEFGLDSIHETKHYTIRSSDPVKGKKIIPQGVAAYGPVRLLTQGSINASFTIQDTDRITNSGSFGLFNPIGILRDLSGPYALKVKPKYYQMEMDTLLEHLQYIIPNVLMVIPEIQEKNYQLKYIQKGYEGTEGVTFDQLPSGTRNFAALILDLMIRLGEQQSGATDPANYRGIVLIDEIDLHLHPKMQKEIIQQLADTFPNIQFIVTTHSPIPLLGAPKDAVFINVFRDENNDVVVQKLDIDITGLLPNAILTSPIFDFESIINVNHNKQERLVTEDDYEEAVFYRILAKKIKDNTLKRSE